MSRFIALPAAYTLLTALALSVPATAAAFSAKPEDPDAARVVGILMETDFSKQCDLSTYPLQKNLSYLFDNGYIGLEFKRWEVQPQGKQTFQVVLHYIDGEAGPTEARWEVNPGEKKAFLGGNNAETLSCMTGYL